MQTNTLPSPPVPARRPRWPHVVRWYAAGVAATTVCWWLLAAISQHFAGMAAFLVGRAIEIGAVVLVAIRACALPRRSRIALVLGVLTPLVLAAAALAFVAWSFAHSDWQF
jgi:hypothetical protein